MSSSYSRDRSPNVPTRLPKSRLPKTAKLNQTTGDLTMADHRRQLNNKEAMRMQMQKRMDEMSNQDS
jgi:hypothetical protein